jgi:SOS-response transcriptional repressor LexA
MIKLDKLFERKYGAIRGAQTKLAAELNVNQSTISSWISGRNKPTKDYVKKMATIFDVSEAEIYAIFTNEETRPQDEFVTNVQAVPLTDKNTVQLPILADIPAGLPEFSDRDVEIFKDIPRDMFPGGADYVIRCIGDSLAPRFAKGDFCVVRNEIEPLHGRPMLVETENGYCMKVINKTPKGVQLCSINKKYKPFYPKSLRIVGLIIGLWSRTDRENLLELV